MKPEHINVPVLPSSPHQDSDCRGVASILARVGDKWSVFVIMMLDGGPLRFNELKRMVGGISQRMLTLTLRGLERDGLVTRTVFPTIPPRVDYELTDSDAAAACGSSANGRSITASKLKARAKPDGKTSARSATPARRRGAQPPGEFGSSSTDRTMAGEASDIRIRSSRLIGLGPSRSMRARSSPASKSSGRAIGLARAERNRRSMIGATLDDVAWPPWSASRPV